MCSREAENTNYLVFGLTLQGLKPMNYHTQGKHANPHTTDAVLGELILLTYCVINWLVLSHRH